MDYYQTPEAGLIMERKTALEIITNLVDALHLVNCGYRLAEKSTPANLRRCILDARTSLSAGREFLRRMK